jgi:CheY-like chemotaxis protein/CHASE3 domain sensor protein/HPt (histidine-containing phosphotransfer) domain-containing protein
MIKEIDYPASAGTLALLERRSARLFLVVGFAITLAFISGVMFLVYTMAGITKDAKTRVEQTGAADAALAAAASAVSDLDRVDGRYRLTAAAGYLSARDADAKAVNNQFERLRVLLADDSEQLARLTAVEPLWSDMLSRLRVAGTTADSRIPENESLTDDISAKLAEMGRDEDVLLAQQQAELQRSVNAQRSTFLGLLALASSLFCVFYVLLSRSVRRRREAENMLKQSRQRAETNTSLRNSPVARVLCDIRGALTAILGYADLPADSETPAQVRFDSIRRQAGLVIASVNEILKIPDAADPAAPVSGSRMEAPFPSADELALTPTNGPGASRFTGRVLLAEDNPDLQQVIQFYLRTTGAEVTVVSDGQQACDRALVEWREKKPFDLILMDVQMPNFDGRSATIFLRNAGYTNPIVALTANATDQERDRCLVAGCNGFLAKPLDQDEFFRTMRRYLRAGLPVAPPETGAGVSADSEFAALRASFQAEMPTRIAEIGIAVLANNFARVADLAHQLKGTAGCYRLTAIYDAAAALNAAAESAEPQETTQRCFQILVEQSAAPAMPEAA